MNRRTFLGAGTGTLASLGGCLFGPGHSECTSGLAFRMSRVNPAEVGRRESRPVDDLGSGARYLVRLASDGGSATFESTRESPVVDGRVVRIGGSLYRVVEQEEEETAATGYEYGVDTSEPVRTAATPEETIDLADLPRVDRTTLRVNLYDPEQRVEEASVGPVVFAYTDREAREASAFVPEPEYRYVRYGETVLRFRFAGTSTVTVTPYRIRLVEVADSAAAYGDRVLAEDGRRVAPADLSPEAREFVRTATVERVQVCTPTPAHVEEVLDTFGVEPSTGDGQHVAYDGNWYEVEASYFDR